jgi:hypothetical protein
MKNAIILPRAFASIDPHTPAAEWAGHAAEFTSKR